MRLSNKSPGVVTAKTRPSKLLIAFLAIIFGIALLIIVSLWRQDAARAACESSKISFASFLSVPCPAVWQHRDGLLVTQEFDLGGAPTDGDYLVPSFRLWYFDKPHPNMGASLFMRLGVTEAFLDELNLGPQEVVARSLKDARSGDLYQIKFWRVGDEWRAGTYLNANFKPTTASGDNASVLAVMAVKYLPQGAGILYFAHCYQMAGPGRAGIPESGSVTAPLIERPTNGCSIDLPHQGFYVQAAFPKELVGQYLQVIETSQALTKRWLVQTN